MYTVLVVSQVLVGIGLVGLVLIQHGKGADAGAAFGSGASGTLFGSQGSANFLSRLTGALAVAFFVISLALAYMVSNGQAVSSSGGSVVIEESQPAEEQDTLIPDLSIEGDSVPEQSDDMPAIPEDEAAPSVPDQPPE